MSRAPSAAEAIGGTTGMSQPPKALPGLISWVVIIRNGIQTVVSNPRTVTAVQSVQATVSAGVRRIQSLPSSNVPLPTVISAIGGAPQNCAITGSSA